MVILADRGFARTELFRTLQQLGLSYVIRLTPKVMFRSQKWHGELDLLPIRPATHKDLGFGLYRKDRPAEQRVVMWWKASEKEAWFLATDLRWGWRKVACAFKLRMSIEELFRDEKNIRYGWGLRQIELSEPERLERLLLALAFAYLLLLLIGVICQQQLSERHWAAALSKKRQASAFFVGRLMQCRHRFRLRGLLVVLTQQLGKLLEENWG